MPFTSKVRIFALCLGLAGALWGLATADAAAQAPGTRESLLSLARPADMADTSAKGGEEIERVLLGQPLVPDRKKAALDRRAAVPPAEQIRQTPHHSAYQEEVLVGRKTLLPGFRSVRPLRESWVRLASANPKGPAATRNGGLLLDDGPGVITAGSLVADPRGLYSSFEILVDRAKYDVRLFGEKIDGGKTLLFQCKAGLGSGEFPTPAGSFYVMRIFDDHPLWIPPPDRDWAWGQAPSRSVYGGHMMPLFTKRPANAGKKTDDTVRDLDLVAPEQEVVDPGFYRIHGTDSPWSVGSAQSHGCVRLLNSSVATLAGILKMYVGTSARGENPNGTYVELARPVKVTLY